MLSVLLASALTDRLGGHGSLSAAGSLAPGARDRVAPLMADAFGHTFWWALGLLLVALAFSFVLPKQMPAVSGAEATVPMVP